MEMEINCKKNYILANIYLIFPVYFDAHAMSLMHAHIWVFYPGKIIELKV